MIRLHTGAIAGDGEARSERKPGLDRLPRLVEPTELRQGSPEPEMREWKISVGLDGAARPLGGLRVGTEIQLCSGHACNPLICVAIAWRKPERVLDMGLGLLGASGKSLAGPNERVRICKVAV